MDSIRLFDHETQESLEQVASCTILARSAARLAGQATVPLAGLLPAGSVIAFVEPMSIAEHGKRHLAAAIDPRGLYRVESILKETAEGGPLHLFISTFGERYEEGRSFDFETMASEEFPREAGKAIEEFLARAEEIPRLFLCANNAAEETRLRELLRERDLSMPVSVRQVVGRISTGFLSRTPAFAVVGHHEIFHRHRRRYEPRKPIPARPIDSFLDLEKGDLVVHTTKGIAAYEGLKVIEGPRGTEEYLCLRFAEKARLFVPSTQIDMVNKYVGGREKRPTLSKLTGRSWDARKSEAEAATLDLARELLEVQARRELAPGHAYDQDTEWQREFEAAFIYEETPDQLEALEVIKSEVCSMRPMDRLLCGDVGYGKTELAMRAAFKVATAGKQVALLAPTTLLVEQHYRTFTERMAEYPMEIRALDRFRTGTEEREILDGLAGGRIDIVIGTHRLVQKDVRFFDLGLLIVDEEQRFGVRHKELLRQFSPAVEVLTMTATPIPRTLHMALLGLRDITTLVTPPQDRMAIETVICRWDDRRIRTAILRELARSGQVLFVHNRVQTIKGVADRVARIVPEARVVVGHGQMPERELEETMMTFLGRSADVLVATTIIENGLDIPTANTIFIDRADMFGLADLHQLRGRVGRYRHRAYAYLLLPGDRPVTPVAAKRIRAIADHSELGAGFKIAMRDLEIRGAGNLLGAQQSGHIAAVGYDLYCRLLDRSVRRLREETLAPDIDVTVDLAVDAMLPPDFIPSERMRMEFYRKLATVPTREDLDGAVREMRDRFGEIPIATMRLVAKHAVRLAAAAAGVLSTVRSQDMVVLRCIHPHYVAEMMKGAGVVARLVDERTVVLPLEGAARDDPEALLMHVTGALASAAAPPPQA